LESNRRGRNFCFMTNGRLTRSQTRRSNNQVNKTTATDESSDRLSSLMSSAILSFRVQLWRRDYSAVSRQRRTLFFSHIKTCCKFSFALTVHGHFHGQSCCDKVLERLYEKEDTRKVIFFYNNSIGAILLFNGKSHILRNKSFASWRR